jgi:hypothetical protein
MFDQADWINPDIELTFDPDVKLSLRIIKG